MFEKIETEARFKNPQMDFQLDVQPIEYRRDPLTGRWTRINIMRARRVKQKPSSDQQDDLVSKTRDGCFFCPENIESATPMFPEEITQKGRIKQGEAVIFPNLFPFAQYHAVGVICREHALPVSGFTAEMVADTLSVSIDYLKRVNRVDPEARYPTWNWNHMPPAGASIIHPHVQVTMDTKPSGMQDLLLRETSNNDGFWHRLVEEERGGERYLGNSGGVDWFTSFAPLGNSEVTAVFMGASAITDLEENGVRDFANGVTRILRGYEAVGVESFNLTIYSAPVGGQEGYLLNAKIISRPRPKPYYTSDRGFMESLHGEVVVESRPEDVADLLRPYWR